MTGNGWNRWPIYDDLGMVCEIVLLAVVSVRIQKRLEHWMLLVRTSLAVFESEPTQKITEGHMKTFLLVSWNRGTPNHPFLVGGWATPLKNDGVRQLGWWHSQLNGKIQNSWQPVSTNQIYRWKFHEINPPAIKGYPHDSGNHRCRIRSVDRLDAREMLEPRIYGPPVGHKNTSWSAMNQHESLRITHLYANSLRIKISGSESS